MTMGYATYFQVPLPYLGGVVSDTPNLDIISYISHYISIVRQQFWSYILIICIDITVVRIIFWFFWSFIPKISILLNCFVSVVSHDLGDKIHDHVVPQILVLI